MQALRSCLADRRDRGAQLPRLRRKVPRRRGRFLGPIRGRSREGALGVQVPASRVSRRASGGVDAAGARETPPSGYGLHRSCSDEPAPPAPARLQPGRGARDLSLRQNQDPDATAARQSKREPTSIDPPPQAAPEQCRASLRRSEGTARRLDSAGRRHLHDRRDPRSLRPGAQARRGDPSLGGHGCPSLRSGFERTLIVAPRARPSSR